MEEQESISKQKNPTVCVCSLDHLEIKNLILTSHSCFLFCLIKDNSELKYLSKHNKDIL